MATIDDVITALKFDDKYWFQRVYRFKPPNFQILPVISVNEYGRKETALGDDTGLNETKNVIVIDLWNKQKNQALIEQMKEKAINLVYTYVKGAFLVAGRDIVEYDGSIHTILEFETI